MSQALFCFGGSEDVNEFLKAARIEKSAVVNEGELGLINAQALRPLAAE